MLIMASKYNRVLTPLLLLSENAIVDILPMFSALVNGPLITSKASLKLKERSLIRAAAVFFARSIVL